MSNYDYWSGDLNATEDILEHHGILGQKWGVRRYQNEDGSLTSAGRKRYQDGSGINPDKGPIGNIKAVMERRKQKKELAKEERRENYKNYTEEELARNTAYAALQAQRDADRSVKNVEGGSKKHKYGENLSNAELQAATQRLLAENQYRQALVKNRVLAKTLKEGDQTAASKLFAQVGVDLTKEATKYVTKATWNVIESNLTKGLNGLGASFKNKNNNSTSTETSGFTMPEIRKPTHNNPGATAPVFNPNKWDDIMGVGISFV